MKTHEQIIREKMKGCGIEVNPYKKIKFPCGDIAGGEQFYCESCKDFFIGYKEALENELEFLDTGVFVYDGLLKENNKGLIISIKNKITDIKNALRLLEEQK